MNVLFDVILVVIFLLVVIISTCRGFVKSIWSMVTIIGAFVLAYMFGPVLGEWLEESFVNDYVSSYACEVVETIAKDDVIPNRYDVSELFDPASQKYVEWLTSCGVDLDDIKSRLSPTLIVSQSELYFISESIASSVSETISKVLGIIISFVASLIIISLLGGLLKLIVKVPIIKSINTILGMILGLFEGFAVVWVLCTVVSIFVESGIWNEGNGEMFRLIINNSYLYKYFCDLSLFDFINIRIE